MVLQGQVPTTNGSLSAHHLLYGVIIRFSSFLEGPKAALVASKDFNNGHYKITPQIGIRAFGRVYSAWAYGQTVSQVRLMRRKVLTVA